ncbi:MAG: hypothetical protein AAB497_03845 [Patescibacteria group bacterium]|mgnify:CR=1 FL=1
MTTTLMVVLGTLAILAGIPLYFIKMSENKGGGTSLNIGDKLKPYAPDYEYLGRAFGLLIVLFLVLWLTDNKLGWFSFMLRDRWTFAAFMVTYLVFVSAFMQDEEKRKKTPFYQKAMVVIMIMAVDFALIGMTPTSIFNWSGDEPSPQPTAQVAPQPPARVVETIVANSDHFTYKVIPDGVSTDFACPSDALMDFTYDGMPEEDKGFIDCGETVKRRKELILGAGAKMTGKRIGFMFKNGPPRSVQITMSTDKG